MILATLSPAKSLNENYPKSPCKTMPRLLQKSGQLMPILKSLQAQDIVKLMGVSEKIAHINHERFQSLQLQSPDDYLCPAIHLFRGDVYQNMNPLDWTQEQVQHAQSGLRILSGLYGILRPYDLIQPYRLEMGTQLQNPGGRNLYEFWGNSITEILNEDLKNSGATHVVNLASKEYFKSVKTQNLQVPVVQIDFKEERQGQYKIVALNAKRARGMMADYIVKNQLESVSDLKSFTLGGYTYRPEFSKELHWVFGRKHS